MWNRAHLSFMQRHLIAHRSGVIDAKYVQETGDRSVPIGRRVMVDASDVRDLARAVRTLGAQLLASLPPLP
jgi:hypothetical protein